MSFLRRMAERLEETSTLFQVWTGPAEENSRETRGSGVGVRNIAWLFHKFINGALLMQ